MMQSSAFDYGAMHCIVTFAESKSGDSDTGDGLFAFVSFPSLGAARNIEFAEIEVFSVLVKAFVLAKE